MFRYLPEGFAPQSVRAKAIELFRRGYGYKRTASELNLAESTVREWKRNFRKNRFRAKPPLVLFRYDAESKRQVLRLRKKGLAYTEIARETGICRGTCYLWCRKFQNESLL